MTEWLKQAEIFAFVAAILLIGIAAGDGKEENPPIIVLSEDRDEFRFALGSADLPHAFRAALSETIVPMVEELAAACACDAIELVGHTDGTPVRGGSNLDTRIVTLFEKGDLSELRPGSNIDLGMMRALSVVSFLRAKQREGRLSAIEYIIPLSAGQLIGRDNTLTDLRDLEPERLRRRIEIRLRRAGEARRLTF